MRKGWKIFWIICGVLAAAGLAFTVLGLVMGAGSMLLRNGDGRLLGGWLSEINWDMDYIEDELENISSNLPNMTGGGVLPEGDYVPAEPDGDSVTEYSEIQEIELDVKNLAVYVGTQNVENVVVDISNLPERYRDNIQVSGEHGRLEVSMKKNWGAYRPQGGDAAVYISLPAGTVLEELSADVGTGFLEMEKISVKEAEIEVGAGQGIITDLEAEKLKADCGAGQLIMSGNITGDAEIDCGVGEVIYTAQGSSSDYDYEVSSQIGEVMIGDESYSGISNKMKIDNNAGRTLKAECGIGSIEVIFTEE
mgnify:CR=1 FL=1